MLKFLSSHRRDSLICLLFLLSSGTLSWMCGQDATWDLLNYHLYNPFAFLTGRFSTDIMPAGIHTFFNPLLDVPLYLLIKYFNSYPQIIAFIQGLWGGALWFVIYKICYLIFQDRAEKLLPLLACAIGITGSMGISQIGLSYNEVPLAFLLVLAFYFLLLFLLKKPQQTRWAFWAAFLAGAAGGLKYTGAPFVVALTVAFFVNVRSFHKPLRTCCLFALGGLAGFLLTNGFFMFQLYKAYGNPVFPFFNSIFKSPFFDPVNFDEVRFYPRSTLQWLFYPFYWIFPNQWMVSEPIVADARLALAQLSFILLLPIAFFAKIKSYLRRPLLKTLLSFCAVGFVLWLHFYSTLRYIVTLEAISGILIIAALRQFFSYKKTILIAILLIGILNFTTKYPRWGREMYSPHAIEITPELTVEPHALVLLVGAPLSFVAPLLPEDTRFIGGIKLPVSKYPRTAWSRATQHYPLTKLYYAYHFEKTVEQAIGQHTGPIYLVTFPWGLPLDPIFLAPLGLRASDTPCQEFNTNLNMYSAGYVLCPLEKISITEENPG